MQKIPECRSMNFSIYEGMLKGIVFFKSYILGLRNNLNPYIIFSFHPRKVFFCTGGINLIYGAKV